MLHFQVEPQADYILVRLAGLVSLAAWEEALAKLETALHDVPGDRIVIDLMGLLGYLGSFERRSIGALMVTYFGKMEKVALAVHAGKITGIVQQEAERGGLKLRLFPQLDEAVSWATSDA